jgi:hypothetical protein
MYPTLESASSSSLRGHLVTVKRLARRHDGWQAHVRFSFAGHVLRTTVVVANGEAIDVAKRSLANQTPVWLSCQDRVRARFTNGPFQGRVEVHTGDSASVFRKGWRLGVVRQSGRDLFGYRFLRAKTPTTVDLTYCAHARRV